MARRARKPLLPILLWGPRKRTYSHRGQVTVRRIPAQAMQAPRLMEDFILATGVSLGLVLCTVIGVL